jgi:hypothetical protein
VALLFDRFVVVPSTSPIFSIHFFLNPGGATVKVTVMVLVFLNFTPYRQGCLYLRSFSVAVDINLLNNSYEIASNQASPGVQALGSNSH